ncbi:MAG: hypothetical protein N3A66_06770, partial [Planctomycetota bacterium]|nr:hypothetical protein [Planctomycetota bacterium]
MRRYLVVIWCCLGWTLACGRLQGEEVLSNQDVVDLIKAGLAKELVIEKIKSCENSFDLTTKAMIQLKEQGVSDDIIALMLQEQKSRRNKVRARLELEIQHLAADRPEVRNAAFLYISRLGEMAVGALQETLGHTRPEMRIAAASALARLEHK